MTNFVENIKKKMFHFDKDICFGINCPLADSCDRFFDFKTYKIDKSQPYIAVVDEMYDKETNKCIMYEPKKNEND